MTNDIDYNQLGKRIKRYRLKAHLTQEQLAEKTDVAASTIAHAENGTSKTNASAITPRDNLSLIKDFTTPETALVSGVSLCPNFPIDPKTGSIQPHIQFHISHSATYSLAID